MLDIKRIPIPALIGIVLTALFVLAAIFAPWIAPHGNGEIVGDVWEPMSATHWLGTDNLGRDLLVAHDLRRPHHAVHRGAGHRAVVLARRHPRLLGGGVRRLVRHAAVAPCRSPDVDPDADHGSRRALRAADQSGDADPGDGHSRLDPRLSPVAGGRRRHQRHGLCRGGQAARRRRASGSSSARSCPTRCRRWFRNSACASSTPCCSCRRCPSSALACSRRMPTGAAWSRKTRTASSSASAAALIPAAAIAMLAISVNLVADWVLNRTTSLKGGRG